MINATFEFFKDLCMPSNVALLFFTGGGALLFIQKFRRASLTLLVTAGGIYLLGSISTVANTLLTPLEYEYPFLAAPEDYRDAKQIVVLTGYAENDSTRPETSRVNSASAFRVLEVQRLYSRRRDCEIIISGNEVPTKLMKEMLIALGVEKNKITKSDVSPHTMDSAANLGNVLAGRSFFLVTSAGHMPRAVASFRKQGLEPIPAPTDFRMPRHSLGFAISPIYLYYTNLAVREYLGLAWYKLTGEI